MRAILLDASERPAMPSAPVRFRSPPPAISSIVAGQGRFSICPSGPRLTDRDSWNPLFRSPHAPRKADREGFWRPLKGEMASTGRATGTQTDDNVTDLEPQASVVQGRRHSVDDGPVARVLKRSVL